MEENGGVGYNQKDFSVVMMIPANCTDERRLNHGSGNRFADGFRR